MHDQPTIAKRDPDMGWQCPRCLSCFSPDNFQCLCQSTKRSNDTPPPNTSPEPRSSKQSEPSAPTHNVTCTDCGKVCATEKGLAIHKGRCKANSSKPQREAATSVSNSTRPLIKPGDHISTCCSAPVLHPPEGGTTCTNCGKTCYWKKYSLKFH
jgi:hypothetical protein